MRCDKQGRSQEWGSNRLFYPLNMRQRPKNPHTQFIIFEHLPSKNGFMATPLLDQNSLDVHIRSTTKQSPSASRFRNRYRDTKETRSPSSRSICDAIIVVFE